MIDLSQNLEMFAGDTVVLDYALQDAEGAPLSLVGASLTFSAKRSVSDFSYLFQASTDDDGVEITDASGGLATITIDAEKSASIVPPYGEDRVSAFFDIQRVDAEGAVSTERGVLTIYSDITRA